MKRDIFSELSEGLDALADARQLSAAEVDRLSADARALLDDWADAGWVQPAP